MIPLSPEIFVFLLQGSFRFVLEREDIFKFHVHPRILVDRDGTTVIQCSVLATTSCLQPTTTTTNKRNTAKFSAIEILGPLWSQEDHRLVQI